MPLLKLLKTNSTKQQKTRYTKGESMRCKQRVRIDRVAEWLQQPSIHAILRTLLQCGLLNHFYGLLSYHRPYFTLLVRRENYLVAILRNREYDKLAQHNIRDSE